MWDGRKFFWAADFCPLLFRSPPMDDNILVWTEWIKWIKIKFVITGYTFSLGTTFNAGWVGLSC